MKRKPVETKKTKMVLEPQQIILRPLVTEKGYHKSERTNAYCFEVNPLATKTDIKNARELARHKQRGKFAHGKSHRCCLHKQGPLFYTVCKVTF